MTAPKVKATATLLGVEHEIRARALMISVSISTAGLTAAQQVARAEVFAKYIRNGIVAPQETGTT